MSWVTMIMVRPSSARDRDHTDHFLLKLGIQRTCRLVKQQCARFHAQGAGNGRALLLPTRKFRRPGIAFVANAHFGQVIARRLFDLGAVTLQNGHRRFHDILQDREVGPQVELLKDH